MIGKKMKRKAKEAGRSGHQVPTRNKATMLLHTGCSHA